MKKLQTVVDNMRNAAVMLGGDADLTIDLLFNDLRQKVNFMLDKLQSGPEG